MPEHGPTASPPHAGAQEAASGRAAGSRLIVALMVGVGLHAFHGVAIVTALPVIADDLSGRSLYGAAISAYLVASIVGLAAAARPIGRRGPLPVFGAGLLVFSLGLGVSAAAPGMAWLVVGRAVEGLGGGVISTVIYASVNVAFPAADRARILALLAAAWVIPTLCAPPLAAWVAETWGWRWVFVGLLPAVVFTWLCGATPLLRVGGARPAAGGGSGVGVGRSVGLALACGALLGAGSIVGPGRLAWLAALGLCGAGVWGVVATVDRVLPGGTLALRRGLPSAIALKTLLAMCFFGVETFLPLATTQLLGWSTLEAGWLLSGAGVTWTLGSFYEARIGGRADGRGALLGAVAMLAGVVVAVVALRAGWPPAGLYAAWWLAAFGMGVGYNVANSTAMACTAPGAEGATSSALGISDSLGIALGSGIGGLAVAAGEGFGRPLAQALDAQFLGMALVGLLAVLVAPRLARRPPAPLGLEPAVAPPSDPG